MPSSSGPLVATCLAFCLAVVTIGAQNPPQAPPPVQQPTFRTAVNAVRVDVIATTKDGSTVDDLTEADFEVTEDGKPQKIESLKLIRVQTRQEPGGEAPRAIRTFDDEATELARDDVRIMVIFLDDYHVSRASVVRLRQWLHRFIEMQIGPYDLVALMYPLTPSSALTFTRDKFALTSVIDKFEGRRGDYTPRNDLEANYAMADPYTAERIRSEVVMTALKGLCLYLGGLNEGRKSVIVVSEGLPADFTRLREVIEAASRGNVSFYPLDPQGLLGPFGASDVLRTLAENTNGRAIVTRNDFEAGLNGVLRDSSAYYLLGYNSEKGPDGKFHEIKVRIKRPGVEVRARMGYLAPTRQEAAAAAAQAPKPAAPPAVTKALGALAEPRGQIIRTWLGMSRGENGKTRLTFVWESPPPGEGSAPENRPARVTLSVSAPNGPTFFSGTVGDPVSTAQAADGRPAAVSKPARVAFDVPPGNALVKLTVEGASSGRSAEVLLNETREIVVPDLARQAVWLSTPAVYVGHTPREFRAVSADPDALPTANRVFMRTDSLHVRFQVYGAAPASVTVRLLNRNGDQTSPLAATPSATRPDEQSVSLPLANLARGDYLIEITAKGETGQAVAMVPFRVAG
jgi:VWFA-related protein